MTKDEVVERLKVTGDTEMMSVELSMNEWAAVTTFLQLAVDAGCPAESARTALHKVTLAGQRLINEKWPDVLDPVSENNC